MKFNKNYAVYVTSFVAMLSRKKHHAGLWLTLILLLAAAVRITRIFEERHFSRDTYHYLKMVDAWASHGVAAAYELDPTTPPLLPWITVTASRWGISPDHTGLVTGVVLGSLMSLAAFWIALNLFSGAPKPEDRIFGSREYALTAAFFVAVHPFLVRTSVSCLREILYFPLVAFAVAIAVSAACHRALWKWCIFAALVALASMARREAIVMLAAFAIWAVIEAVIDRGTRKRSLIHYGLALVLVALIYVGMTFSVQWMLRDTASTWSGFGKSGGYFFSLKQSQ